MGDQLILIGLKYRQITAEISFVNLKLTLLISKSTLCMRTSSAN